MLIFDNVLDVIQFKKIKHELLGLNFPWFYSDLKVNALEDKHNFQLTHILYDGITFFKSNYFDIVTPIIAKIDPLVLIKVKANLTFSTNKPYMYGMHVDLPVENSNLFTGVFYLNNTDGPTVFETGEHVTCIENRLVIFPFNKKHTAVSCTNSKVRCVINFNFIVKDPSVVQSG